MVTTKSHFMCLVSDRSGDSLTGPAGTFRQRTELTGDQKAIFGALGLPDPPRVLTAIPV
jgi:hypothetical protein